MATGKPAVSPAVVAPAGPMATAASVDGATEPTARPSAADVNDSSVKMPRNDANLQQVTATLTSPAQGTKNSMPTFPSDSPHAVTTSVLRLRAASTETSSQTGAESIHAHQ